MKANRYLRFRNGHWHYKRRVPSRYAAFDDRCVIRFSLKTDSFDIACIRRDAQVQADDLYWASLLDQDGEGTEAGMQRLQVLVEKWYRAASLQAFARGFTYASID